MSNCYDHCYDNSYHHIGHMFEEESILPHVYVFSPWSVMFVIIVIMLMQTFLIYPFVSYVMYGMTATIFSEGLETNLFCESMSPSLSSTMDSHDNSCEHRAMYEVDSFPIHAFIQTMTYAHGCIIIINYGYGGIMAIFEVKSVVVHAFILQLSLDLLQDWLTTYPDACLWNEDQDLKFQDLAVYQNSSGIPAFKSVSSYIVFFPTQTLGPKHVQILPVCTNVDILHSL